MKDELLARTLAEKYHKGQKDKAGVNYFSGHICTVVSMVPEGKAKVVAYLHDIIEDTDMTAEKLLEMGFDRECVAAVVTLTHKEGVPYMEYIQHIKKNLLAAQVKKADLIHNMDLSRLKEITESDKKRIQKYERAYRELTV